MSARRQSAIGKVLHLTYPPPRLRILIMDDSNEYLTGDGELIQVEVKGLMLDPVSEAPIVVLRDAEETRFLPIWIGVPEANAIALVLEEIKVPRPMTHDLFISALQASRADLVRIEIHKLIKSTFYARLVLEIDGDERLVDARPSDAIALALRANASIWVHENVLKEAKSSADIESQEEDEKIKDILKNLDEEDLGDYKM